MWRGEFRVVLEVVSGIPVQWPLNDSSRVTTPEVLVILNDYATLLWWCRIWLQGFRTLRVLTEHYKTQTCYTLIFLFIQNVLVQRNASSLLSKLKNNKYLWSEGWTNFPQNGERYFIVVILKLSLSHFPSEG